MITANAYTEKQDLDPLDMANHLDNIAALAESALEAAANNNQTLYLRVVKSARGPSAGGEDECHIYDADGNRLGILPCLSIEGVVNYNRGIPVMKMEIIANRIEMESLHRKP